MEVLFTLITLPPVCFPLILHLHPSKRSDSGSTRFTEAYFGGFGRDSIKFDYCTARFRPVATNNADTVVRGG